MLPRKYSREIGTKLYTFSRRKSWGNPSQIVRSRIGFYRDVHFALEKRKLRAARLQNRGYLLWSHVCPLKSSGWEKNNSSKLLKTKAVILPEETSLKKAPSALTLLLIPTSIWLYSSPLLSLSSTTWVSQPRLRIHCFY